VSLGLPAVALLWHQAYMFTCMLLGVCLSSSFAGLYKTAPTWV